MVNANTQPKGFIPGRNYDLQPPVLTNCIPVTGGEWTQKLFSHGMCLKYENNIGIFQGKPDNENQEHFFKVEWGPGSTAAEVPQARRLTAVE